MDCKTNCKRLQAEENRFSRRTAAKHHLLRLKLSPQHFNLENGLGIVSILLKTTDKHHSQLICSVKEHANCESQQGYCMDEVKGIDCSFCREWGHLATAGVAMVEIISVHEEITWTDLHLYHSTQHFNMNNTNNNNNI